MLSSDTLKLDAAATAAEIEQAIREQVLGTLRRRGAVVGMSGGIDSSVVAALCARALGRERVLALLMPERDSGDAGCALGRTLGAQLGVETLVEDIGPILAAAGCYERQADAIRMVFPEYGDGWRCKVALPPVAGRRPPERHAADRRDAVRRAEVARGCRCRPTCSSSRPRTSSSGRAR